MGKTNVIQVLHNVIDALVILFSLGWVAVGILSWGCFKMVGDGSFHMFLGLDISCKFGKGWLIPCGFGLIFVTIFGTVGSNWRRESGETRRGMYCCLGTHWVMAPFFMFVFFVGGLVLASNNIRTAISFYFGDMNEVYADPTQLKVYAGILIALAVCETLSFLLAACVTRVHTCCLLSMASGPILMIAIGLVIFTVSVGCRSMSGSLSKLVSIDTILEYGVALGTLMMLGGPVGIVLFTCCNCSSKCCVRGTCAIIRLIFLVGLLAVIVALFLCGSTSLSYTTKLDDDLPLKYLEYCSEGVRLVVDDDVGEGDGENGSGDGSGSVYNVEESPCSFDTARIWRQNCESDGSFGENKPPISKVCQENPDAEQRCYCEEKAESMLKTLDSTEVFVELAYAPNKDRVLAKFQVIAITAYVAGGVFSLVWVLMLGSVIGFCCNCTCGVSVDDDGDYNDDKVTIGTPYTSSGYTTSSACTTGHSYTPTYTTKKQLVYKLVKKKKIKTEAKTASPLSAGYQAYIAAHPPPPSRPSVVAATTTSSTSSLSPTTNDDTLFGDLFSTPPPPPPPPESVKHPAYKPVPEPDLPPLSPPPPTPPPGLAPDQHETNVYQARFDRWAAERHIETRADFEHYMHTHNYRFVVPTPADGVETVAIDPDAYSPVSTAYLVSFLFPGQCASSYAANVSGSNSGDGDDGDDGDSGGGDGASGGDSGGDSANGGDSGGDDEYEYVYEQELVEIQVPQESVPSTYHPANYGSSSGSGGSGSGGSSYSYGGSSYGSGSYGSSSSSSSSSSYSSGGYSGGYDSGGYDSGGGGDDGYSSGGGGGYDSGGYGGGDNDSGGGGGDGDSGGGDWGGGGGDDD